MGRPTFLVHHILYCYTAMADWFFLQRRFLCCFACVHATVWGLSPLVDGGCGHLCSTLTCSVWGDSARYMSKGVLNEWLLSFGGDKPCLQKIGCDLWRSWHHLYLLFYQIIYGSIISII